MHSGLATLFTLGLLFSFLHAVVVGLMLFVGVLNLTVAAAAVVVINVLILLVSPWFDDRIYGWLYAVHWMSPRGFEECSPASTAAIEGVTGAHRRVCHRWWLVVQGDEHVTGASTAHRRRAGDSVVHPPRELRRRHRRRPRARVARCPVRSVSSLPVHAPVERPVVLLIPYRRSLTGVDDAVPFEEVVDARAPTEVTPVVEKQPREP